MYGVVVCGGVVSGALVCVVVVCGAYVRVCVIKESADQRAWQTLASIKRTSVILISRTVSRKKGITNKRYATEKWVWSGVGGGPKEWD